MFQISTIPLNTAHLQKSLASKHAGALSCFEGRVRDHNDGKEVLALEYEAYDTLCEKEAQKIFSEVQQKFDVIALQCVHRVGRLEVGEAAVWVGVLAAHRDSSFQACRYIIDEIKKRLPIWKKEFYHDGHSDWVACQACGEGQSATI